jgi:hypothetical protein
MIQPSDNPILTVRHWILESLRWTNPRTDGAVTFYEHNADTY